MSQPGAGLYLHIPFCCRRCRYCDFYSQTDQGLKARFVAALCQEMAGSAKGFSHPMDSIYLGGGTPSLLSVPAVSSILESASKYFCLSPHPEITLEANPGTVELEKLKRFYQAGVNRINIGVQSFQADHLKFLGRSHNASQAIHALEWAREAGFDRLGMDLIYGLPGQSAADWQADMEMALTFAPEHLSAYLLSYEPGTALERSRRKGDFYPLSEAEQAGLFHLTSSFLRENRYDHYEISNFARKASYRSRHNRKYWNGAPYLGLGPGAHSFDPPWRCWNLADIACYLDALESGDLPPRESERLTREQAMTEAIMLGLRQKEGMDIQAFNQRFGVDFLSDFSFVLEGMKEKGLLAIDQGRCGLSYPGMAFSDAVIAALIEGV